MDYMRQLKVAIPEEVRGLFPQHETLRFGIRYRQNPNWTQDSDQPRYSGRIDIFLVASNRMRGDIGNYTPVDTIEGLTSDDNGHFAREARNLAQDKQQLAAVLMAALVERESHIENHVIDMDG